MSGLFDEPADTDTDYLSPFYPDEVTVQLRVTTAMAYALRELAKAYQRLAKSSEEAAHAFAEHLAELASRTS